jgi:hypothetical protein
LNIDGFLGDFYEFSIQLSSRLNGLPVRLAYSDSVKANATLSNRVVQLKWSASPELVNSIEAFRVGRKVNTDVKNRWTDVSLKLNAYGTSLTDYMMMDTLPKPGSYTYMILGIKKGMSYPVFLHTEKISFTEGSRSSLVQNYLYLSPGFEKKGTLEVLILNSSTESVIDHFTQEFDPKVNKNIGVSSCTLGPLIQQGQKSFIVEIKNLRTKERRRFPFMLNDQGKLIPYDEGQ